VNNKRFDIVVHGATGVTGTDMARHLAATLPAGFSWALSGRRADALAGVRADLPKGQAARPDIMVVDNGNSTQLRALAESSKLILNAAGPYASWVEPLLRRCISCRTHYVDLGGETFMLSRLIEELHEPARAAGVALVPIAGYESAPFDLAVAVAVQRLQSRGHGPAIEAKALIRFDLSRFLSPRNILSAGSVGTFKSLLAADDGAYLDPTCLLPPSERTDERRQANRVTFKPYRLDDGTAVAPMFPTPFLNVPVILRTAFLQAKKGGFSSKFHYKEGTDADFLGLGRSGVWFTAAALGISNRSTASIFGGLAKVVRPLTLRLLEILPMAWLSGPTEDAQENMPWSIEAKALDANGHYATAALDGRGHPGYRATARIAAEIGRALVEQTIEPGDARAGFITPSVALGTRLGSLHRAGVSAREETVN